ncbi:uncharacterized protein [Spinacia oleracea]|uniref:GTD-binding domain-containing protein n=1 Tax=Spinacia oleracea TaxID=3562 RepID=A0ABM3R8A9_SPIOL|nr:uncharacterized protein LOC110781405 [Spinacia oleracea]
MATVYDMDGVTSRGSGQLQAYSIKVQNSLAFVSQEGITDHLSILVLHINPAVESSGGSVACTPEEARAEAESLLKLEEDEFLKSIAIIIEAKMKEIQDKIDRFEEKDLQLEREWHQLRQMQHQLHLDKLTLLFHKTSAPKSVENFQMEMSEQNFLHLVSSTIMCSCDVLTRLLYFLLLACFYKHENSMKILMICFLFITKNSYRFPYFLFKIYENRMTILRMSKLSTFPKERRKKKVKEIITDKVKDKGTYMSIEMSLMKIMDLMMKIKIFPTSGKR